MRFSILHVSDLHRGVADEIDTGALLDSLVGPRAVRRGRAEKHDRKVLRVLLPGDLEEGC
jgi:hypothetical protein